MCTASDFVDGENTCPVCGGTGHDSCEQDWFCKLCNGTGLVLFSESVYVEDDACDGGD